ncbi:hypothetical protein TWF730_009005 [Orbilia blumenaviensis]|uniref:Putative gamma-glutamylcyclotransferase n=1 Tax=Orbilia blumenaviensis TaxID=1796055 RepID=A0AAV9UX94_9PEZI
MMVDEPIAKDYVDEADWASIGTTPSNSSGASERRALASTKPAFEPTLFFFYGTLAIPAVLRKILGLREDPVFLKATVRMFKVKMWGPYPALVRLSSEDPRGDVAGVAYTLQTEEHLRLLETYEGENYAAAEALIELQEPRHEHARSMYGKTFVWKGYPEELVDGVFDIATFRSWNLNKVE